MSLPIIPGLSLIDAHVHFWDPRQFDYPWLASIPELNRPRLPADFGCASNLVTVEKMVFVEAGCAIPYNLREVEWATDLARQDSRIGGLVANVPLERGSMICTQLQTLARNPLVKGVRRILQSEPDAKFCLQPQFIAGVQLLAQFGFSLDLCIGHDQLPSVTTLARLCPEVPCILDHLGKPPIKQQQFDPWRQHLKAFAELPNTWCKISGLATEADHHQWKPEHLAPYIEQAIHCFGFDRLVFGSDWPVCTLASTYSRWVETMQGLLKHASPREQEKLLRRNAQALYRL